MPLFGKKKKKKEKKKNADKKKKKKTNEGDGGDGVSGSDSDAASVDSSPPGSPASAKIVRATFQKGKLGMGFRVLDGGERGAFVDVVTEGSQAESQNVEAGFRILTVAGDDVTQVSSLEEIYRMMKKAPRPLLCTFRPPLKDSAGSPDEDDDAEDIF